MLAHVFKVFENQLIDYAGLFPPTQLPLEQAIHNYAEYIRSDESWKLSTFVIPVSQLEQLLEYQKLFDSNYKLKLSVTGKPSQDNFSSIKALKQTHLKTYQFAEDNAEWLEIVALEYPFAKEVPSKLFLDELYNVSTQLDVQVFCEIPVMNVIEFEDFVVRTMEAVVEYNQRIERPFHIKLRTGNENRELVPSSEKVAYFIQQAMQHDLTIKFTAGLHHPVRMYRDEIEDKMHGHLNVFIASALAKHFQLDLATITSIIEEESEEAFVFTKEHIGWKEYEMTAEDFADMRDKYLNSFGSCSFNTPTQELIEVLKRKGTLS
ncbi:hypothetical protein DOS78_10355 [Staphylococcus felis]|nr:hypothetical protein DOS65_02400 [Staphylococcus felis]REI21222.1 hypothetical protein DOS78_10355 [Staphylococcus felis]